MPEGKGIKVGAKKKKMHLQILHLLAVFLEESIIDWGT